MNSFPESTFQIIDGSEFVINSNDSNHDHQYQHNNDDSHSNNNRKETEHFTNITNITNNNNTTATSEIVLNQNIIMLKSKVIQTSKVIEIIKQQDEEILKLNNTIKAYRKLKNQVKLEQDNAKSLQLQLEDEITKNFDLENTITKFKQEVAQLKLEITHREEDISQGKSLVQQLQSKVIDYNNIRANKEKEEKLIKKLLPLRTKYNQSQLELNKVSKNAAYWKKKYEILSNNHNDDESQLKKESDSDDHDIFNNLDNMLGSSNNNVNNNVNNNSDSSFDGLDLDSELMPSTLSPISAPSSTSILNNNNNNSNELPPPPPSPRSNDILEKIDIRSSKEGDKNKNSTINSNIIFSEPSPKVIFPPPSPKSKSTTTSPPFLSTIHPPSLKSSSSKIPVNQDIDMDLNSDIESDISFGGGGGGYASSISGGSVNGGMDNIEWEDCTNPDNNDKSISNNTTTTTIITTTSTTTNSFSEIEQRLEQERLDKIELENRKIKEQERLDQIERENRKIEEEKKENERLNKLQQEENERLERENIRKRELEKEKEREERENIKKLIESNELKRKAELAAKEKERMEKERKELLQQQHEREKIKKELAEKERLKELEKEKEKERKEKELQQQKDKDVDDDIEMLKIDVEKPVASPLPTVSTSVGEATQSESTTTTTTPPPSKPVTQIRKGIPKKSNIAEQAPKRKITNISTTSTTIPSLTLNSDSEITITTPTTPPSTSINNNDILPSKISIEISKEQKDISTGNEANNIELDDLLVVQNDSKKSKKQSTNSNSPPTLSTPPIIYPKSIPPTLPVSPIFTPVSPSSNSKSTPITRSKTLATATITPIPIVLTTPITNKETAVKKSTVKKTPITTKLTKQQQKLTTFNTNDEINGNMSYFKNLLVKLSSNSIIDQDIIHKFSEESWRIMGGDSKTWLIKMEICFIEKLLEMSSISSESYQSNEILNILYLLCQISNNSQLIDNILDSIQGIICTLKYNNSKSLIQITETQSKSLFGYFLTICKFLQRSEPIKLLLYQFLKTFINIKMEYFKILIKVLPEIFNGCLNSTNSSMLLNSIIYILDSYSKRLKTQKDKQISESILSKFDRSLFNSNSTGSGGITKFSNELLKRFNQELDKDNSSELLIFEMVKSIELLSIHMGWIWTYNNLIADSFWSGIGRTSSPSIQSMLLLSIGTLSSNQYFESHSTRSETLEGIKENMQTIFTNTTDEFNFEMKHSSCLTFIQISTNCLNKGISELKPAINWYNTLDQSQKSKCHKLFSKISILVK